MADLDIAANLEEVRRRVALAAERSGRAPSAVDLLVVTKTWPPGVIAQVVEAGRGQSNSSGLGRRQQLGHPGRSFANMSQDDETDL